MSFFNFWTENASKKSLNPCKNLPRKNAKKSLKNNTSYRVKPLILFGIYAKIRSIKRIVFYFFLAMTELSREELLAQIELLKKQVKTSEKLAKTAEKKAAKAEKKAEKLERKNETLLKRAENAERKRHYGSVQVAQNLLLPSGTTLPA